MANLFANLPLPALNGPGAAVDTSGMGAPKTIVVTGNFTGSTISVEISVDGGTEWAPLVSFQTGDHEEVLDAAAQFMRVNVRGRKATVPFAATVDVGAPNAPGMFAAIPMPLLNGPGPALDISAFGDLSTFVTGGSFPGATITVEASEDGAVFAPFVQFGGQGGQSSLTLTAAFVRANVSGRKAAVPFTGTLAIGACPIGGGGADVPSSLPATVFIFRPGGVAHENVYVTWPTLMVALNQVEGDKKIEFDDSIVSPCVVPAGGPYNMRNTTWGGTTLSGGATLSPSIQVDEGVTFSHLRRFSDPIRVTFAGVTPPIADFFLDPSNPTRADSVLIDIGAEITCSGTGPFFQNNLVGGSVAVILGLSGRIITGTAPVFDCGAAGSITAFAVAGPIAELRSDTISGVVGSVAVLFAADSGLAAISETQTAFLGTLIPMNLTRTRWYPTDIITSDTTVIENQVARVDSTAAPVNITLPLAFNLRGQTTIVKSIAGLNPINILPSGADTIDGGAAAVLAAPRDVLHFVSDGVSDWMIV